MKAQTLPAPGTAGVFAQMAGAFVTIHKRGQLRGCIGHVEADEPLGRVITRCAVAAASSDPRFYTGRPRRTASISTSSCPSWGPLGARSSVSRKSRSAATAWSWSKAGISRLACRRRSPWNGNGIARRSPGNVSKGRPAATGVGHGREDVALRSGGVLQNPAPEPRTLLVAQPRVNDVAIGVNADGCTEQVRPRAFTIGLESPD